VRPPSGDFSLKLPVNAEICNPFRRFDRFLDSRGLSTRLWLLIKLIQLRKLIINSDTIPSSHHGKEVIRMKKEMSNSALLKEAAFWETIKKTAETNPAKSCLK
jgi:hypothetical protein